MIRADSLRRKEAWYNLGHSIDRMSIVTFIIGIFLARANVLNGLAPFGFAFLLACIITKNVNIMILASVIIGTASLKVPTNITYMVSYILVSGYFKFRKSEKSYSLVKAIIIGALIFTLSRMVGLLFGGQLFIYDIFIIIFEGILVFTMSYIFSFGIPIESIGSTNLNNEKIICTFITLSLALAGISNIVVLGINIKCLISIITILFLSYNQGVFIGGTVGIILGMVGFISEPQMPFILGIFGISGLLAGVFKDLGRIGSVLGFILGNGIISYYVNGLGTSFLNYREIFLGAMIFLITSKGLDEKISKVFAINLDLRKNYSQKKDEIAIKKLNRLVELFDNLSSTFKDSAIEKDVYSSKEVYCLVDGITNGVCKNCYKYNICWKNNYYKSYQNFFNLIGLVEIKGANNDRVRSEAKKFCVKDSEVIEIIANDMEKLKLNHIWKSKLKDNRLLLSEQLEGVSKIIENITTDIYINPTFNEEVEKNLYRDLKDSRIDVREVSVAQLGLEDFEIFIDLNTAIDSESKLKNLVSKSLGFPVINDTNFRSLNNQKLRFKLLRHNRYNAITKVANLANSENKVSGDSFTYGEVDNTYFAALSDGMGIGKKANEESKVAISLLERLMEANIDKDLTLRTINSVLRVKSNEEIFATLDIGFVDLYSGKLQMIKTGSPATFIKRGDRVDVISEKSLPVGLLKDIDFNIYEDYLEDGDIIIMMSDGILDANRDMENSETWMKNIIINLDYINPQSMANEIIKEAEKVVTKSRDDMTVLVTKVWKNI